MADADWRKILSLSQKELLQADKQELCESLSWMEADDIELNFSDLKTLFKLAQDILKYKSEQVKNLMGELDTIQRKRNKKNHIKNHQVITKSDNTFETVSHQEEIIKANKDILKQLHAEIAELEERKSKYSDTVPNLDKENESSPDVMTELDTKAQLENEVYKKNRHIRKLLGYVKLLEDENAKFKEKISMLKEKLKEATKIIENLTDQMLNMSDECKRLKESLGSLEQVKSSLLDEISALRQEILSKKVDNQSTQQDVKVKIQQLKNLVQSQRIEIENLMTENKKIKGNQFESQTFDVLVEKSSRLEDELRIKELGEKLLQASKEIVKSADLIDILKKQNKHLKSLLDEFYNASEFDFKNESDDGKERTIINKLKKKNQKLTSSLQYSEEMIVLREKQVLELSSKLNLLQSDEDIKKLLNDLKDKKEQIKIRDEENKSMVKDINRLNEIVNTLQMENETMRQKLNLSLDDKIPTEGILLEFHNLKQQHLILNNELKAMENKLVELEIENREQKSVISKNIIFFNKNELMENNKSHKLQEREKHGTKSEETHGGEYSSKQVKYTSLEFNELVEENEGLRKGLQEILMFLKENSNNHHSGILALKCPSLEAVLYALEARHAAGWFAPHMATTLELKAAIGGKDALLAALHESRKEIFDLMNELSKESQTSTELRKKLLDAEEQISKETKTKTIDENIQFGAYNSWLSMNDEDNIDLLNKTDVEALILKRNTLYEKEVKNALTYFRNKFEILFDKMTEIAMTSANEKNKWLVQEELYKAQIENLSTLNLSHDNEDVSDISPGLVNCRECHILERKCIYLEELYKNVKSSYENINSKLLGNEKDMLLSDAKFESKIQNLILVIVSLAEKIRYSLPEQIFFKQNMILNETVIKYRQMLEADIRKVESNDLFSRLELFKTNAMEIIMKQLQIKNYNVTTDEEKSIVSTVKKVIDEKQIQEMCSELKTKNKQIDELVKSNMALQEREAKLIDNTIATETKEEISIMKSHIIKLNKENGVIKEQYKQIQYQLDTVQTQLNDDEQRRLSYETEINMLRHQILDLQSVGDNKAIIARLSNEILVAHVQTTEGQKTIENLKRSLFREKERRIDAEEALTALHKVLDMVTMKHERKFSYMNEVIEVLRLQYQGCLPLTSVENYMNNLEELYKKQNDINKKYEEIEALRYSLMTKHSVYDQVLQLTNANCSQDLENCPHKLQLIVSLGTKSRELERCNSKIQSLEKANENFLQRCNYLEKTLVMSNQGLTTKVNITKETLTNANMDVITVEDIQSDSESESREGETFTIPKPHTSQLKNQINIENHEKKTVATSTDFPERIHNSRNNEQVHIGIQSNLTEIYMNNKLIQTDVDSRFCELNRRIKNLENINKQKDEKLGEQVSSIDKLMKDNFLLNEKNKTLHTKNESLTDMNSKLITLKEQLDNSYDLLKTENSNFKISHREQINKMKDETKQEMQSLLLSIKQIEIDKNNIVLEYKELLQKEREDNCKIIKDLQSKVLTLQSKKDRKSSDNCVPVHSEEEIIKESVAKYSEKNIELENECFKLQHNLENYKTEIVNSQSELQRWKNLASERLQKMEQLSLQLKERHNNEVESYKAENKHWLVQLNETQKEHMELRSRLTEEKAIHVKQLSEKDAQIEQLRIVVHNLKTQIINMQTMLSVHDPSFDLSAIVEVEEASDVSQQGFDRLELNFESSVDLHEIDDLARVSTSTTIWQEPIIERLRRDKHLLSKQNGVLRRQIKAIAARERRARLDAQNLKNQVFRISTSGSKAASAESVALHNKIASLQAQLMSARRDTHSSVALWDKWKRAQQASERWQARYDEKCQEVIKLEASLNLAKSAVSRLEKEKRVLLSRLAEAKNDKQFVTEKQEDELSEKPAITFREYDHSEMQTVPVSTRALLERIEAQQRRIVALEIAEKGNEPLVSEYEKALAEITSLKGQVLKLESTLLESQIQSPLKNAKESQPELEYWKSYCNMLKEENAQLTLRVNSLDSAPTTVHQHRVNDLEQTVLTLRGLVSKLQAEQKSSASGQKRVDSRPNSGRSASDKVRNQLESSKTEISNLKKSIQEKDALLERSKDMLRIAAEREDELLSEVSFLRQQLQEMTDYKKETLSV